MRVFLPTNGEIHSIDKTKSMNNSTYLSSIVVIVSLFWMLTIIICYHIKTKQPIIINYDIRKHYLVTVIKKCSKARIIYESI